MTDRWEQFARDDAEYYILTGPRDEARFYASGQRRADAILRAVAEHVGDNLAERRLAIEIGCGIGRLALPMAAAFREVVGVDVAATMLSKLSANARARGLANVHAHLPHEPWDTAHGPADLVYSVIAMQHIERFAIIREYLERTARALAPRGIAYLNFDTRPATLAYRVRNRVPDPLLPRPWRRGIRRIRRDARELREVFADVGLRVLAETAPASDRHVFVLGA